MLMDDMMMSFHHNGAYFVDGLRNDDEYQGTGTAFSNPFPFYNYEQAGRETFEFECNLEDDDDDLVTIQIDID